MNPFVENLKAMENVTQVVPSKMEKQIKENKKLFGRRIEQLAVIIEDNSYIPKGSENTYHEFIRSMWQSLVTGRRITPKMESAITKIVKSYAKQLKENNDPKLRKQKLDYTENTVSKIHMIKRRLDECNYTRSYTVDKLYFLESIERQVYSRGSLSIKQRKALNKMYLQFEKKLEKSEKKT
mgnify:CR=1 FL=1